MDKQLCERTGVRRAACACAKCARGKRTSDKNRENRRDVGLLLDAIRAHLDHGAALQQTANWADVGDIGHLRGLLLEIVAGFALGADGDERDARQRVERALCADDVCVPQAMVEVLFGSAP